MHQVTQLLNEIGHGDPRAAGQLSVEDAGQFLGIARATADRYWAYARAWLYEKVSAGEKSESG